MTQDALLSHPEAQPLDGIDGEVECVAIHRLTADVSSFDLYAPAGFAPGQYLTVRVGELGLERCYSISSAPQDEPIVTITVQRVPGGVVSNYLHDRLAVGDRLRVSGPYGLFSTNFHPSRQYLFVAGGSGITPIMSMLRSLLRTPAAHPPDIVLVHNASTPDDIIFRDELDALARLAGVRVLTMCSRDSETQAWAGRRGRVSREVFAEDVPELLQREVFLCGPGDYMASVRAMLEDLGVAPARVHEESFVFGRPTRPAGAPGDLVAPATIAPGGCAAARFSVEFRGRGTTIACDQESTVLDAASEAGIALPSSCEEGACGSCKSTLLSGEVDMDHAGGIRPKEIAAGKFLPCCSTPLSDLVIE